MVFADNIEIVGEFQSELYSNSYVNDMRDVVVFANIIEIVDKFTSCLQILKIKKLCTVIFVL